MQSYEQPQYRFGFGGNNVTKAVRYLLISNGVVYFLQIIIQAIFKSDFLIIAFGLQPYLVCTKFFIWQLVSYMFLHGGFWHILMNMFILWMFGCEIERSLGFKEFAKYYIICGIGGGLMHIIIHPFSSVPVIGASGAIYGLLAAFAILFPDRQIMLFPFFLTLKAKYWVLIFVGITLIFGLSGQQDGVAHFAHLGGMIVGFLYFKFGYKLNIVGDYFKKKQSRQKMLSLAKKKRKVQQLREEVDVILDKINEGGYENLTDKEKRTLKDASDLFSKE